VKQVCLPAKCLQLCPRCISRFCLAPGLTGKVQNLVASYDNCIGKLLRHFPRLRLRQGISNVPWLCALGRHRQADGVFIDTGSQGGYGNSGSAQQYRPCFGRRGQHDLSAVSEPVGHVDNPDMFLPATQGTDPVKGLETTTSPPMGAAVPRLSTGA
jgi:hypothetical protein